VIASERPAGAAVICTGVVYDYGTRRALAGVSWSAAPGMTAVLGRNGAGKTTLLRILVSLLQPSRGHVTIDGHDTVRDSNWVRRHIGYLPQDFLPFPELTTVEFLEYIGGLAGSVRRAEIDDVIVRTNLERFARTRTARLSGGTRRRLGVAQALLGHPQLLVVDEPTTGLDPEERVRIRQLLADLATRSTVLLSTHLVEDVAALVDHVLVFDEGRLLFDGRASGLEAHAASSVQEVFHDSPTFPDPRYIVSRATPEQGGFRLRLIGPANGVNGKPVTPSLEDGYLALVRRPSAES